LTVISQRHINLVAKYADLVIVISDGRIVSTDPGEVITKSIAPSSAWGHGHPDNGEL
jgi:ABC-type hemin transport system ATPase subunit